MASISFTFIFLQQTETGRHDTLHGKLCETETMIKYIKA